MGIWVSSISIVVWVGTIGIWVSGIASISSCVGESSIAVCTIECISISLSLDEGDGGKTSNGLDQLSN